MAAGQLVFDLVAKTDRWSGGLNRGRSSLSSFVSGGLGMLAKLNLAVGTLRMAFDSLAEPLALATTQIQAEAKLEQVFKSTGGAAGFAAEEIKKFAAERQKITNFGDEVTIAGAAVLATFKEIKGDTFKDALTSAQDLSALLGTDLQSSILMVGKALNEPTKGLTALRRAGVSFTDQQVEMIKKLEEVGQVADAQRIILGELQSQFGGQAKALADPITQAKNDWGDALEEIGYGIRDLTNEILREFDISSLSEGARQVVDFFNSEWKDEVVQGIKDAADAGKGLYEAFKFVADNVQVAIDKIKELKGYLPDLPDSNSPFNTFDTLFPGLTPFRLHAKNNESAAGVLRQIPTLGGAPADRKPAEAFTPQIPKDYGPDISKEMQQERSRLIAEGKAVEKSVMTPIEKFQAEIDRLTNLFQGGFIDKQTFDRASQLALDNLPQAKKQDKQVRTLQAKSSEAFDVLRANANPQLKAQNQQLSEAKKQTKELQSLNKQIKKRNKNNIEVKDIK